MLGVITSIGGFLFGYDTGQISGMLLFEDFINRFGQTQPDGTKAFDTTISSLVVSTMSLGTLAGALLGAYTADWFGRRRSLSIGVAIFVIGNIIQITSMTTWVHLMVGRIVAGVGVGILSIGVPMFQSECCPREIRGAVVASYQLMITIGILVSNIINYGVRDNPGEGSDASWRIVIGLGIGFSLPLGIGILFSPESPRWLAGKGRWEEARMSLARLRGKKHDINDQFVTEDFKEMQESIEEQKSAGQGTWLECLTGQPSEIPRLVYRTLLGCALQFFQQWTGVNYFFYVSFTYAIRKEPPLTNRLVWRNYLQGGWYCGSHPDTADSRCRQRCHDNPRSLHHREGWSPCPARSRRSVAGCMVAHLRHHRNCAAPDREPKLGHRHDCLRLHVHRLLRGYLGSIHLGCHWRNLSSPHTCEAGFSRNSLQLAW